MTHACEPNQILTATVATAWVEFTGRVAKPFSMHTGPGVELNRFALAVDSAEIAAGVSGNAHVTTPGLRHRAVTAKCPQVVNIGSTLRLFGCFLMLLGMLLSTLPSLVLITLVVVPLMVLPLAVLFVWLLLFALLLVVLPPLTILPSVVLPVAMMPLVVLSFQVPLAMLSLTLTSLALLSLVVLLLAMLSLVLLTLVVVPLAVIPMVVLL